MNRQFRDVGWDLHVVFGASAYGRRTWTLDMNECRFQYTVLNSTNLLALRSGSQRAIFLYSGLLRSIWKLNPDVVIVTGFSLATIKVWLLSFVRRIKYLIFSGTIQEVGYARTSWRIRLRRLLARRASGAVAYGVRAKEYLEGLGLDEPTISIGINTVDVEFFYRRTEELRRRGPEQNTKRELLYVGYLVKRKRVDLLLDLASELRRRRDDFVLTIVGDGPELPVLTQYASRLELSGQVRFEGYKQKSELPQYFARATCFLFPTASDIWGLVVNEAMAAGVPCIVSPSAGVAADLIKDGHSGWVADFSKTRHMADKIEWVLDNPEERRMISIRASDFVRRHASLQTSAAGFVEAVLRAYRSGVSDGAEERPAVAGDSLGRGSVA